MREILFRGKRADNWEWIEGGYAKYNRKHYIISVTNGFVVDWFEVVPDTVGQYTGLNDRNGKRIFEGDVVKGYNTFHHREEQYIVRYKVIGFFFCENENEWHPDYIEEMRVIGNIHDNPEMIGGKEDEVP